LQTGGPLLHGSSGANQESIDTNDGRVIVVINVDQLCVKETSMKHVARFVVNWRVELILMAMVLSLGTTVRAQLTGADWCSDVPVMSYFAGANLCMGDASDCYLCVVWARYAE
jgi:hypothetical protein